MKVVYALCQVMKIAFNQNIKKKWKIRTANFCKRYNHINNPDDKASISVETLWLTNISHGKKPEM